MLSNEHKEKMSVFEYQPKKLFQDSVLNKGNNLQLLASDICNQDSQTRKYKAEGSYNNDSFDL